MIPESYRSKSSSIEEGIVASFGDVILSKEGLVDRNLVVKLLCLWRTAMKRIVDITGASVILLISLPLFIFIGVAVKVLSKGPVFFRQDRVGYKGKVFKIWKFRTMSFKNYETDHRQYIQYLLKEGVRAENRVDLLAEYINYVDEKTTPIGRFLRATSLDELPQLINIILGDMSIVGPRPHPVYEVNEYKEWYKRRLTVKPGLTGWSKLNLRCTPKNYEEAVLYDLWYVDNWNLVLDLRIILQTVPFVILNREASASQTE
jgi:lipopolysaccharide/colanic/teichoic acid biosynthesis glycosyltransferase